MLTLLLYINLYKLYCIEFVEGGRRKEEEGEIGFCLEVKMSSGD